MLIPSYLVELICENLEAVTHEPGRGFITIEGEDEKEVMLKAAYAGWKIDIPKRQALCPMCRFAGLKLNAVSLLSPKS